MPTLKESIFPGINSAFNRAASSFHDPFAANFFPENPNNKSLINSQIQNAVLDRPGWSGSVHDLPKDDNDSYSFNNSVRSTFTPPNPSASNFLKSFIGGDMSLQDDSGSIQFNPQTGTIAGASSDPQSYRFSINPRDKFASIGKGPIELSGGFGSLPGPHGFVIGQQSMPKQSPWGMVGFKFPAPSKQDMGPMSDFSSNNEYQQNHPASRLPPEREFASSDVENLYNQTVGKPNPRIWGPDSQPYLR